MNKELQTIEECILTLGTGQQIDPETLEEVRKYALKNQKRK